MGWRLKILEKLHNPSINSIFWIPSLDALKIPINMFYQEYHNKIFSFSFVYFSSIANVIALSILYVKHPKNHNNQ